MLAENRSRSWGCALDDAGRGPRDVGIRTAEGVDLDETLCGERVERRRWSLPSIRQRLHLQSRQR